MREGTQRERKTGETGREGWLRTVRGREEREGGGRRQEGREGEGERQRQRDAGRGMEGGRKGERTGESLASQDAV